MKLALHPPVAHAGPGGGEKSLFAFLTLFGARLAGELAGLALLTLRAFTGGGGVLGLGVKAR